MSGILFEDIFNVKDIDKNGKQFDRGGGDSFAVFRSSGHVDAAEDSGDRLHVLGKKQPLFPEEELLRSDETRGAECKNKTLDCSLKVRDDGQRANTTTVDCKCNERKRQRMDSKMESSSFNLKYKKSKNRVEEESSAVASAQSDSHMLVLFEGGKQALCDNLLEVEKKWSAADSKEKSGWQKGPVCDEIENKKEQEEYFDNTSSSSYSSKSDVCKTPECKSKKKKKKKSRREEEGGVRRGKKKSFRETDSSAGDKTKVGRNDASKSSGMIKTSDMLIEELLESVRRIHTQNSGGSCNETLATAAKKNTKSKSSSKHKKREEKKKKKRKKKRKHKDRCESSGKEEDRSNSQTGMEQNDESKVSSKSSKKKRPKNRSTSLRIEANKKRRSCIEEKQPTIFSKSRYQRRSGSSSSSSSGCRIKSTRRRHSLSSDSGHYYCKGRYKKCGFPSYFEESADEWDNDKRYRARETTDKCRSKRCDVFSVADGKKKKTYSELRNEESSRHGRTRKSHSLSGEEDAFSIREGKPKRNGGHGDKDDRVRTERKRRRSSPRDFGWSKKSGGHSVEDESSMKIDKKKLFQVARKNCMHLLESGVLQTALPNITKERIESYKPAGTSISDFTKYCKKLTMDSCNKDDLVEEEEEQDNASSDSEITANLYKMAFHKSFQLRQRPNSIVMNIRDAVPLQPKSAKKSLEEFSKTVRLKYPVSSGQEHRQHGDWVDVSPKRATEVVQQVPLVTAAYKDSKSDTNSLANSISGILPAAFLPTPSGPITSSCLNTYPLKSVTSGSKANAAVSPHMVCSEPVPGQASLTNNQQSADSKANVLPDQNDNLGLFTGSTGVKVLTPAELSGGFQPWLTKKIFERVKPVAPGFGMHMLQKMGWKPGEGLGKNKQGPVMPLEPDSVKNDKKGLVAKVETSVPMVKSFKQQQPQEMVCAAVKNNVMLIKHPVSALNEYCAKRKWAVPQYICHETLGSCKRTLFIFTVTVEGRNYTPRMPSLNKKAAKLEAATLCLRAHGLLPSKLEPPPFLPNSGLSN